MGYYSGIIEHDTGIHADAEQQADFQKLCGDYFIKK